MLFRYAIKRFLFALPLLLGITIVSFGILHLAPGGPVSTQGDFNPRVSPESIRELRALYGLDKPVATQYWDWLSRLARLDLGNSFRDHQPVINRILQALPATLLLNVLALLLVYGVGLPLGVFSAVRKDSRWDKVFTLFSFVAFAIPAFVLALVLQMIFGSVLGWFPLSGFRSPWLEGQPWWRQALDISWHMALPVAVSAFGSWVQISRYMRNSFLEVMNQDYIRTARAKGLKLRDVYLGHALPNAMLPIITLLGLSFPSLIGGSIIIETIFAWPGMGRKGFEAAINYDYPLVMGIAIMGAVLTVAGNLLADIAYAVVDPRVRYEQGK
jgi:peptide/nickel transport system permease protein